MNQFRNPNWSIDELKMAVNVYCKIPFIHTRKSDPEIIRYAKIIGRSPGALYTKICNFGRFDNNLQNLGIKGLTHGSNLEPEVWNMFISDPEKFIYETEIMLAERTNEDLDGLFNHNTIKIPQGEAKDVLVKQRIGENFFRKAVLASYNSRCCISGCSNTNLLEACHISEWANDKINRLNPSNGLCMNVMFHKAYDKMLMSITPDYKICYSEKLIESFNENSQLRAFFVETNDNTIILPSKFLPDKDCLAYRHEQYKKVQN